MPSLTTSLRWTLLVVSTAVLLVVGGFASWRVAGAEEVLGDVRALGVRLGGLDRAEATATLEAQVSALTARPARFLVAGQVAVLDPAQVGFEVDVPAMVAEAIELGRQGGIPDQFRWWLEHLGRSEEIEPVAGIDRHALEQTLSLWDTELIGDPPFPGAVEVESTEPVPVYPRDGEQIDREAAPGLVLSALTSPDPIQPTLPVTSVEAEVDRAAVDRAVRLADLWLSAPVTLRAAESEVAVTFSEEDLASALRSRPDGPELRLVFDPGVIGEVLDRARGDLEQPPVDARFEIEGYQVRVVPGSAGTLIDPEATSTALAAAAGTSARIGLLPFMEGAEPDMTTAELEALGIEHLVSQFTTYHDCCRNRVTNIHLIADAVDGAIIAPGETFSLNEHVGPRTTEKGYLEDGTIVQGELTETVGGGVSQFATTFYNAVFWGGYEDVEHKPHSFYFSRYPEGVEATISWPQPDLIFRNDSQAGILIDTAYTDTSITVRFFGGNDGRMVAGAHSSGGGTDIEVLAEGGANARRVSYEVSGRYAFTEPPSPEYRANPDLEVDEQRTVQEPDEGWSVSVTRTIEQGGETRTQEWVVRYAPQRAIIEVHPCMVPDTSVECPQPTTTTTSPSSTTVPATTVAPQG